MEEINPTQTEDVMPDVDIDISHQSIAKMQKNLIHELYHDDLFTRIGDNRFGFYLGVAAATPLPQNLVYLGLHQCYSTDAVKRSYKPSENDSGDIAVKRLLDGHKGHFSPYEHASITFVLEGFNHGTLQQLLRSRIGVSPSVQSFRYTSKHILDAADGKKPIEEVVYLRPVGVYHDREKAYEYKEQTRMEDLSVSKFLVAHVAKRLRGGMPPEQARGQLGFDYRQHAVITVNTRSLMGILDRRSKKDAQAEIQILAALMMEKFAKWQPQTADWYTKNRWQKALLSP